jgi:transcriptional regulator GlxA family with amidase domain
LTNTGTFDQRRRGTVAFEPVEEIISRSMKTVIEYIRANSTANISLPVLARIAGVTPHHFSALFRKTTGLSAHQYILRERIERSKLYLRDEELSVKDVSRLTGFRTQGHFTKVFRKLAGGTPSEFRHRDIEQRYGA